MSRTVSIYLDSPKLMLCPNAAARPSSTRRRTSISRLVCLTAASGCTAIALALTILYSHQVSVATETGRENTRLNAALNHLRVLAEAQSHEAQGALADARRQLGALQAAATIKRQTPPAATSAEAALAQARGDLAAANAANRQLTATLDDLGSRASIAAERDVAATARIAALQSSNAELLAQADALKSQILQLAAQVPATDDSAAPPADDAAPAPPTRWAMNVSYDTAKSFAALCFDRDSLHETPAGPGSPFVCTAASRAASAAIFSFTHDAALERVYAASITVSLAADTPRDRLAENSKLVNLFLKAFAPACRNPDDWLNTTARQLAGKDSSHRAMLLDTTYKITAANDGHGTFTFRVESPHEELTGF